MNIEEIREMIKDNIEAINYFANGGRVYYYDEEIAECEPLDDDGSYPKIVLKEDDSPFFGVIKYYTYEQVKEKICAT